ncbi:MAG: hypothetical protein AB1656_09960 [Candidatus Omnitrophota bacterium]
MMSYDRNSHHDRSNNSEKADISRRSFLGGAAALAALRMETAAEAVESSDRKTAAASDWPRGKSLRVLPVLVYHLEAPKEMASWRSYGDIHTQSDVEAEAKHIAGELKDFAEKAEFPIEVLPVRLISGDAQAKEAAASGADAILIYAASGGSSLYAALAESKAAKVMYIRHKTKPYYLYYEIAHWRFLRRNEDAMAEPNMDAEDIVIDDYGEVLWRMRAIYGLKNAKGTKMLAIGSLAAYSEPAQNIGPQHAKEVWDYEIEIVPREEFAKRIADVRSNEGLMKEIESQTKAFLGRPNLTLQTKREYVFNSILAWHICRELLQEKQAFNFGFDYCMGREVIEMLGTPPCLVLAMANDAGYTAYCHTDLSHTCPGVLLRWIAGKPTFVCNTHFPHDGQLTVAHCAAPMRMNGHSLEPVTIMTHYESDFGAATRVHYPIGQTVTVVIPNLHCSQWQGFRGKIAACPSLAACRSQMDIEFDGDMAAFIKEMEGFHAQVVYGDYLREVGYALKRIQKIEWRNFS